MLKESKISVLTTSVVLAKPVAVCTRCRAFSHSAQVINERCGHIVGGKRCQGVYRSSLAAEDWKECPNCGATGKECGNRCIHCSGEGWLFIRQSH